MSVRPGFTTVEPDAPEVLPASQWMGEKPAPFPPALVKGIFPQTGVATIGGQSGGGKSFQAIHLGVRLIPDCQQHFYIDKYRIKRHGGVLYLVLEGKPAFPLRLTAAFEAMLNKQMKFGERAKLPFCWNTYQPNLFEKGPDTLLKLAEREAKKMREDFNVDLVAVFLDTMGLAACYENEDRAAQVQKVVLGLGRLSDATGALAINVDHMGKDQEAGLRGTSAKRDCVETIVTCLIDRDKKNKPKNHRLQLFKIRDGEEGRTIPYRLRPVDMGVDEDGDVVSTCVVQWEFNRQDQPVRQAPRKKQTDISLESAIKEVGLPCEMGVLRAAFYKYHGGSNHAANVAWNRAVNNKLELDEDGRLDFSKE
jgi:RecA-family ATPase